MTDTGAERCRAAALEVGVERVEGESGQSLGDELRRQSERLAYRSAMEHVRELRRIETALCAASLRHGRGTDVSVGATLEVIRCHMVRGLWAAQEEVGDRAVFWLDK